MFKEYVICFSLLALPFLSYTEPRAIAVCAVGTGLSYSGMYLSFKEKRRTMDDLVGLLMFVAGVIVILESDNIVNAFNRIR